MQKWYKYVGFGAVLLSLVSCFEKKHEPIVAPWGVIDDTVSVSDEFDLHDIQTSGELIMATVSGPHTYYEYHGKSLGTQFLICQRFADSLGDTRNARPARGRQLHDQAARAAAAPFRAQGPA